MRRAFCLVWTGLLVWAALPCPARSCSLCPSFQNMQTLRTEVDKAAVVLYGTAANPRFNTAPDALPGSGVTDLHVLEVIKSHPQLTPGKVFAIDRYIPILDPKDPPKYLVFCDVGKGKLDAYGGRTVNSPALLRYLSGATAQQARPRVEGLLYFFDYLDHEDADVAADAFLEFAKATDAEVAEVGKRLAPERLRKLVRDPKTPPERLTLLALLLGTTGSAEDAFFLERMIDNPDGRTRGALDGLLCGFIQLKPEAGWAKVFGILEDERRPFPERLAASRVLRFYHNARPVESRPQIVRGLRILIAGDMADVGIEDLRRWQVWDLTPEVLGYYNKPSHAAPITKRAIVRYALSCPTPEARRFTDLLRRQVPDLIQEVEETLQFERRPAQPEPAPTARP